MNNSKEIKFRIKSVSSIYKVTKAMGAIAASRMKKAQEQTLHARPYILRALELLSLLKRYGFSMEDSPLVAEKKSKKILVLMITPDRGLCGGLISNLVKSTLDFKAEQEKDGKELSFIVVGKKGASFLKRTGANILAVFPDKSFWKLVDINPIHKLIISSFLSDEYGSVVVIYSNFISAVRQKATARPILPLTAKNLEKMTESKKFNEELKQSKELIYKVEPSPGIIAEELIPHLLKMGLYYLFLETKASEHSARMLAMENSRKNAKELADDLTLSYNKLRQAQITSQIAEIVGGAAVMEE